MISPQTILLSLRFILVPSTSPARAFLCTCVQPAALLMVCAIALAGITSTAHAQSEQTLVSNIEQPQDVFLLRQQGAYQAFTTGGNDLGYVLNTVEVYFVSGSASSSHITASLHNIVSGDLGNKVADLVNPDKIVAGSNVFTAPAGIALSAGAGYAVVLSISGNWNVGGTYSRLEDSAGRSDWSIEDTYYNLVGSGYRPPLGRFSLMIKVNGIVAQPPSDDATLGGLSLTGAGGDIGLTPVFSGNTTEYGTQVPNGVMSLTLDAITNHPGADLKYMDGKEQDIRDADPDTEGFQVALMVGENVFKVQVEAENGDKRTYTVSVTRQGGPITLELDTIAGDDVVNILEKAGGIAITGRAGTMEPNSADRISVSVEVGSETLTTATDATGAWSISVPPDAAYIAEPGVTVTVNASGPHMSTAPALTRDLKVDLTPPELESAVAEGGRLTLTFDETLARRAVSPELFSVSVNGAVRSEPAAAAAGGNTVTLDLAVPVSGGDTVTLSYAMQEGADLDPVQDEAGNGVREMTGLSVVNNTGAGEQCAGSEEQIRLLDGGDGKEGRVEICADDDPSDHTPARWGTVCDDYWNNSDADVACRALGYERSEPQAGRFLRSRFGSGRNPIWLDDMRCAGDETSLLDCRTARGGVARDLVGVHNCKATEIVGVRCMAAGEERTLSVADASVEEGGQLAFPVLLNEAADWQVSVTYRTRKGSATDGEDYEHVSGKLTFAPRETEKTVAVATLDDDIDDDGETLTLHLNFAFGARIEDGLATGTIHNSDPLPQAWLGRFGRASAAHIVDMLDARFDEAPSSANLLGSALLQMQAQGRGEVDVRQFLAQSSFDLSLTKSRGQGKNSDEFLTPTPSGPGESAGAVETVPAAPESQAGRWSLWGRGAMTRFSGQDAGVSLSGDVLTGLVGLDYAKGRWLAGTALAYHDGNGSYSSTRNPDAGKLDSALVTVNPYLRYAINERLSAWGAAGYGMGTLQLRQDGRGQSKMSGDILTPTPASVPGEVIETDMRLAMGALGLRGVLYSGAATELALKTDALWVRTTSEATDGMQGASAGHQPPAPAADRPAPAGPGQ